MANAKLDGIPCEADAWISHEDMGRKSWYGVTHLPMAQAFELMNKGVVMYEGPITDRGQELRARGRCIVARVTNTKVEFTGSGDPFSEVEG